MGLFCCLVQLTVRHVHGIYQVDSVSEQSPIKVITTSTLHSICINLALHYRQKLIVWVALLSPDADLSFDCCTQVGFPVLEHRSRGKSAVVKGGVNIWSGLTPVVEKVVQQKRCLTVYSMSTLHCVT